MAALALPVALLATPAYADRTVCQKWVTVGRDEDETEYLVDVWSIVDRGPIRTYHYEEDRSKSSKANPDGFMLTGMSSYHAVDCEKMVYADINVQDADLNKVQWRGIDREGIASREAEAICSASLRDRPHGASSE